MGSWAQCCCVSSSDRLDKNKNKNVEEYAQELKKLDEILEDLNPDEAYIYTKIINLDLHQFDCM